MSIRINIDDGSNQCGAKSQQAEALANCALERPTCRVKRVEVHLDDQSIDKKFGTSDMHSLLEAWLDELQPDVVTDAAQTMEQTADGLARERMPNARTHQVPRR